MLLNFDMMLDSYWMVYLFVLGVLIVGLIIMMGVVRGCMFKLFFVIGVVFMGGVFLVLSLEDYSWWWVIVVVVFFFIGFNYLEVNFFVLVLSIVFVG